MPEAVEKNQTQRIPRISGEEVLYCPENERILYPEQREDDMGETSIYAKLINKLLAMLLNFFAGREDMFISSNMNLYYEEGNPNKWFAPDLLIAFGVPNRERASYRVWKENVFPQVIVEVSSETTWKTDVSEKLEVYSDVGAEEYYILDPEFKYLPAPMLAFHRQNGRLLSVPVDDGRIHSPLLGLEIVRRENTFRLFDPNAGEFLLTLQESEQIRREKEAEIEKLKAEIKRLKSQN